MYLHCEAQFSMSNMEKRYRNEIIIIIIVIIIIIIISIIITIIIIIIILIIMTGSHHNILPQYKLILACLLSLKLIHAKVIF